MQLFTAHQKDNSNYNNSNTYNKFTYDYGSCNRFLHSLIPFILPLGKNAIIRSCKDSISCLTGVRTKKSIF